MAVKVEKAPFLMDFGGFVVELRAGWLYCDEKGVKVQVSLLRSAIKEIGKKPIGTKFLVGLAPDREKTEERCVNIWRDEHRTHLGCLNEPTSEFSKKYLKLIKHLNDR